MRHTYKILVGKPKWNRPPEKSRHRWEGNIRIDLREMEWKDVNLIHLAQDRDQ
jgi:hypothetical protein